MTDSDDVQLEGAKASDATLLGNLLELYMHDLSKVFPQITLGPDGRFGYTWLPLYWSEPDKRYPFLIRCSGQVAGFALVTRGSPALSDSNVLDVAEFFVLRRYRRAGVGGRAAAQLWRSQPGTWVVRVSLANVAALAFWSELVVQLAGATLREVAHPREPQKWRVFVFESG